MYLIKGKRRDKGRNKIKNGEDKRRERKERR